MTVLLLALGRGRFDIYSEPPEEPLVPPDDRSGRWRRWAHTARVRWQDLVEHAQGSTGTSRFARWRDRIVCHLAETLAEQRTLSVLRARTTATLLFPSMLDEAPARAALTRVLGRARRHHGLWLTVDLLLFVGSAVLAPFPGPNVVAYYLAFRVVGHFQSWRGAGHALSIRWTFEPDQNLAELASLVDEPRDAREARVEAIAARLQLHRLSAYFERVAV